MRLRRLLCGWAVPFRKPATRPNPRLWQASCASWHFQAAAIGLREPALGGRHSLAQRDQRWAKLGLDSSGSR